MTFAIDLMTRDVVTIGTHSTLIQAVETLLQHNISGLPVVDDEGQLVGIITEFALLSLAYSSDARNDIVSQHMTRHVISVEENTRLSDIADLFFLNRVRRVPVTREGRLTGIIIRRDLLRRCYQTDQCFANVELLTNMRSQQ